MKNSTNNTELYTNIMKYEQGELDEQQVINLFQELVCKKQYPHFY